MCDACADVLEDAALELAEQVLLADDTGFSGARRKLTAAERRARTRFGDLDRLETAGIEAAALAVAPVFTAAVDAVLDAVAGGDLVDARALTLAVERLAREQPARVRDAAGKAAAQLRDLFEATYAAARDGAAREAMDQGVARERVDAARTPDEIPGAGLMATLAGAVALTPWQRVLSVVQRDHTGPAAIAGGPVTAAALRAALQGIPHAGAVDEARQGVHQMIGAARVDAAAAAGPARIWASELLDGNTCPVCAAVDGREYESLEAAREDYPLGGFARCDGGPRCRGTLIFEYRPGRDGALPEPPASILDDWGAGADA